MTFGRFDYQLKSYVPISHVCLKWRIHRFSIWPVKENEAIQSENFNCASTMWIVEVYPKVDDGDNYYVGIFVKNIYLQRDLKVRIKVSLKDYKNSDHYARTAELNFRKGYNPCSLAMCTMSRQELLVEKRDKLLQSDVLTVYCEITVFGDVKLCKMEPREEKRPVSNSKMSLDCSDMLSEKFGALYEARHFCDVILKTAVQEFLVHKVILAAHSPVFALQFKDVKTDNNVVEITDIDTSVVEDFIYFMYTGKVDDMYLKKAMNLLLVAEKYAVEDLKSICAIYLSNIISLNNFACIANIAETLYNEDLLKAIKTFFVKNVKEVVFTGDWTALSRTNPSIVSEIKKDFMLPLFQA